MWGQTCPNYQLKYDSQSSTAGAKCSGISLLIVSKKGSWYGAVNSWKDLGILQGMPLVHPNEFCPGVHVGGRGTTALKEEGETGWIYTALYIWVKDIVRIEQSKAIILVLHDK